MLCVWKCPVPLSPSHKILKPHSHFVWIIVINLRMLLTLFWTLAQVTCYHEPMINLHENIHKWSYYNSDNYSPINISCHNDGVDKTGKHRQLENLQCEEGEDPLVLLILLQVRNDDIDGSDDVYEGERCVCSTRYYHHIPPCWPEVHCTHRTTY